MILAIFSVCYSFGTYNTSILHAQRNIRLFFFKILSYKYYIFKTSEIRCM